MKRLLFFVTLIFPCWVYGQAPTAAQTLRLARATYEQGRLHEIPSQLNDSLLLDMNQKQDKVEAYKILCLSYIYLEEPAKADQSMLNILETDPYFEINEAVDPAEFVALYKTFRTRPIYRIGAKIGLNATQPNVTGSVSAVQLNQDSEYKYGLGFFFGGVAEFPLNDKMTVHGEFLFIQKNFKMNLIVDRETDELGNPQTNQFEGTESQNWISLPVTFEYRVMQKKINPYVATGLSVDLLLKDELTGERTRTNASSITETTFEFKPLRENINISAIAAIGVKLKLAGGYIVSELRYIYGITKLNSERTAFANQEATWEQGYADPIFKLSSLCVTGSYIHNIFKPKKQTGKK
ncbi:MAG: porin family protein [Cyclobacteriaceae bacterium]